MRIFFEPNSPRSAVCEPKATNEDLFDDDEYLCTGAKYGLVCYDYDTDSDS